MPLIHDPTDVANVFTIKTSHYLIAGMSLVTALSWNEAIKRFIDNTYPVPKESMPAVLIYSVVMTFILILIIWCLPDTKSELPLDTQHRIHRAEMAQNKYEMKRMLHEIYQLRLRNRH